MSPRACALGAALLLACSPAYAASVSYLVNQSNKLPDGVDYLRVTLSDEGAAGAIDVTVEALSPLLDIAEDGFGITKFAFNLAPGTAAEASDLTGLPDQWLAKDGKRVSVYGRFDIVVKDGDGDPTPTLNFSIDGVDLDTLESYAVQSTGHAELHPFFVAEVERFNFAGEGGAIHKALFTDSGDTAVIPLPATAWLLGSAGVLIAGRIRRRRRPE
jgi:hypothetical protein